MTAYDVHFCFVSQQVDPNLFPIFDKNIRPSEVVLFSTPDMKGNALLLKEALSPYTKAMIVDLPNSYDVEAIQDILMNTYALYEEADKSVVFNITGGTKLMGIAAFNVCQVSKTPFMYLNLERQNVLLFENSESLTKPASYTLDLKKINFDRYLQAHHYTPKSIEIDSPSTKAQKLAFCEYILTGSLSDAVNQLNALASQAKDRLFCDYEGNLKLDTLLDQPIKYGWVKSQNNGSKMCITFKDETWRQFLNGGWLEFYVAQLVRQLIGDRDVYLNLTASHGKNKNEIDVIFFHQERLHIVEVKTCRFDDHDNNNQNIVHKLESLTRDMGGLSAKSALVSLYPLPPKMASRIHDKKIELFSGNTVSKCETFLGALKQWIN